MFCFGTPSLKMILNESQLFVIVIIDFHLISFSKIDQFLFVEIEKKILKNRIKIARGCKLKKKTKKG